MRQRYPKEDLVDINFIPTAFRGEEDTCPVCIARLKLESILDTEHAQLVALTQRAATAGGATSEDLAAIGTAWSSFARMLADYRVAFAVNLSIWFSAERLGRVKKVPDLIAAYDEYRTQTLSSIAQYDHDCTALLAVIHKRGTKDGCSETATKLGLNHQALMDSCKEFWVAVDAWTDPRREQVFKVV
jgi:hypothetical protein